MADAKIQFQPGSLFYDSVMSFQGALTGVLLFHPRVGPIELDPIGLASTLCPAVYFPPQEVRARFAKVGFDVSKIVNGLVVMLINSTYEIAKAAHGPTLHQFGPELEFFRHLRNAASHGGRWHLINDEPRRPASWRGKEVTKALHGQDIWAVGIKEGDLFFFLRDVQDALPS